MLLLAVLTRLFSWGLRSSAKGSAHLTNVQAVAILLSQLEQDVQRAHLVQVSSDSLRLKVTEEDANGRIIHPPPEILYEATPQRTGFTRQRLVPGQGPQSHVFCRDLVVDYAQGHPFFRQVPFPEGRIGIQVCLKVTAPPPNQETFEIERLIFCGNPSANVFISGWQRLDTP
jgi:hypothetical protein